MNDSMATRTILKAYHYKLRSTLAQEIQLRQFGGAARWVYKKLFEKVYLSAKNQFEA